MLADPHHNHPRDIEAHLAAFSSRGQRKANCSMCGGRDLVDIAKPCLACDTTGFASDDNAWATREGNRMVLTAATPATQNEPPTNSACAAHEARRGPRPGWLCSRTPTLGSH
jgi:hypothetical protein